MEGLAITSAIVLAAVTKTKISPPFPDSSSSLRSLLPPTRSRSAPDHYPAEPLSIRASFLFLLWTTLREALEFISLLNHSERRPFFHSSPDHSQEGPCFHFVSTRLLSFPTKASSFFLLPGNSTGHLELVPHDEDFRCSPTQVRVGNINANQSRSDGSFFRRYKRPVGYYTAPRCSTPELIGTKTLTDRPESSQQRARVCMPKDAIVVLSLVRRVPGDCRFPGPRKPVSRSIYLPGHTTDTFPIFIKFADSYLPEKAEIVVFGSKTLIITPVGAPLRIQIYYLLENELGRDGSGTPIWECLPETIRGVRRARTPIERRWYSIILKVAATIRLTGIAVVLMSLADLLKLACRLNLVPVDSHCSQESPKPQFRQQWEVDPSSSRLDLKSHGQRIFGMNRVLTHMVSMEPGGSLMQRPHDGYLHRRYTSDCIATYHGGPPMPTQVYYLLKIELWPERVLGPQSGRRPQKPFEGLGGLKTPSSADGISPSSRC
ncbi:hypothetical protein QBC35DRAFT_538896 [Podospora australis]|uniref:Uncharacterized protein n=1 Tax=Podospora australis TaxID=1536484 RepID=A0AAN6X0I6_9PEZI|nr:hypothetical protein QBC35DRAFT_538896 [Podospora australis]